MLLTVLASVSRLTCLRRRRVAVDIGLRLVAWRNKFYCRLYSTRRRKSMPAQIPFTLLPQKEMRTSTTGSLLFLLIEILQPYQFILGVFSVLSALLR